MFPAFDPVRFKGALHIDRRIGLSNPLKVFPFRREILYFAIVANIAVSGV